MDYGRAAGATLHASQLRSHTPPPPPRVPPHGAPLGLVAPTHLVTFGPDPAAVPHARIAPESVLFTLGRPRALLLLLRRRRRLLRLLLLRRRRRRLLRRRRRLLLLRLRLRLRGVRPRLRLLRARRACARLRPGRAD
jgi:hypothetical protein